MGRMEVRDVTKDNITDLVELCVPPDDAENPLMIEGKKAKSRWAAQLVEHGSVGKLAYAGPKPVGMIQYMPKPEERLIWITCVFVPEEEQQGKGVGKSLLKALIADMSEPKPYFGNEIPLALVAYAFEVPGRYPQHKFFSGMGFRQVGDDSFLMYYPLKEGFEYVPKEEEYHPQEEDRGRALIFYDPSCPFCISFSERMKKSIREVEPSIQVRMINEFEEREEARKRGNPSCVVNMKAIKSFFFDRESFQREVREALDS